VQNIFTHTTN